MAEQEMVTCFYPQQVIITLLNIGSTILDNLILAVLMSEVVKFITCLGLVYLESGGVKGLLDSIDKQIIKQPIDTLKVCVPSFVYLVQNNLLYVSASHLDAATYQVGRINQKFRNDHLCYNF